VISVSNLSAYYGDLQVLKEVSLTVGDSERVAIFGHNGAGKTTLLNCVIGAHREKSGTVEVDGQRVIDGAVHRNVSLGLGFVPQGHSVFSELSVEENLSIAALVRSRTVTRKILEMFPILDERRSQRAGTLSGGQQQMLALGMALMTQPRMLLLDEPATGLAPVIVENVLQSLLETSRRDGIALVMVEQNVHAALRIVDRAIVLKLGSVIFDGPAEELKKHEDLWSWF